VCPEPQIELSLMAYSLAWPLAEIFGLEGPVCPLQPLDEDVAAVHVNGKIGRAVDWIEEKGTVNFLLNDGFYIEVAEDNLREYTPPAPEDGGFDVLWPALDEQFEEFALTVGRRLESRGWCLVQLLGGQETWAKAAADAKALPKFTPLKKEQVTDYLGRQGQGKTAWLPPERGGEGALQKLDRKIAVLAETIAPLTEDAMAFHVGGRTAGMVCVPYASAKEQKSLAPEPLNADDVDEGVVEEHIKFLRQRRLCCMMWLENQGGNLTLEPRPDHADGVERVRLPLSCGKLLVFRCDQMAYTYEPLAPSVVLQAWVMEEEAELEFTKVEGDSYSLSEAHGILKGRPHPVGDRARIFSVFTRLPGNGYGGDEYWAMLLEGTDGAVEIPMMRFDTDVYCTPVDAEHVPGLIYAHHGAFCSDDQIYAFDNEFFDITADEASHMAPTQRVLLEDAYSVCYKGGMDKKSLAGQEARHVRRRHGVRLAAVATIVRIHQRGRFSRNLGLERACHPG
jgi:polyketide synthase-associated protein